MGVLSQALLAAGEYEEAVDAALDGARLDPGTDPEVESNWIRAAVRYSQTGEPQPFQFPDGYLPMFRGPVAYTETGQRELALGALETLAGAGMFERIAGYHVGTNRGYGLFRDDPRYQAILDEAGITW